MKRIVSEDGKEEDGKQEQAQVKTETINTRKQEELGGRKVDKSRDEEMQ